MLRLEAKLSERANLIICIAIAAAIAFLVAGAFRDLPGPRKDFYDNLWAPANLLLHEQNPYLPASIKTGLPTLWLPMALGAFLPLGLMSAETAARAWFILNVIEGTVLVLLATGAARKPSLTAASALALYFFPAAIQHFVLGQFALTATVCLVLAAKCARKGQEWRTAFLLALAFAKPQLAFLALIGLLYFWWRQGGFRRALIFGGKLATAAGVLSLPVLASQTAWLPAWWENLRSNPAWPHPSLFSVLRGALGGPGFVIWVFVATGGVIACVAAWKHLHPEAAMAWTLALTTVIAPYIWSWDFVLLMPLWISAFARADGRRKLFLILIYAAGWAGMAMAQLRADANNQAFWWVPLWFTLAVAAITRRELQASLMPGTPTSFDA